MHHAYESMTVASTMTEIAKAATKHLEATIGKGKLRVTREQARDILRKLGSPKPERWKPETVCWLFVPPSWRRLGSMIEHEDDEIRIMREHGWRSPAERAAARASRAPAGAFDRDSGRSLRRASARRLAGVDRKVVFLVDVAGGPVAGTLRKVLGRPDRWLDSYTAYVTWRGREVVLCRQDRGTVWRFEDDDAPTESLAESDSVDSE